MKWFFLFLSLTSFGSLSSELVSLPAQEKMTIIVNYCAKIKPIDFSRTDGNLPFGSPNDAAFMTRRFHRDIDDLTKIYPKALDSSLIIRGESFSKLYKSCNYAMNDLKNHLSAINEMHSIYETCTHLSPIQSHLKEDDPIKLEQYEMLKAEVNLLNESIDNLAELVPEQNLYRVKYLVWGKAFFEVLDSCHKKLKKFTISTDIKLSNQFKTDE